MHGDADYLFDPAKDITLQSRSDIIRLALLNRYGGVWADSTMLCLEPLDRWLTRDSMQSGLWMYHGNGGRFEPGLQQLFQKLHPTPSVTLLPPP